MRETALVTILMQGGMTHSRAVAFERRIDDLAIVPMGADGLASILMQWRCLEAARLIQRIDDAESMCDLLTGKVQQRKDPRELCPF